MNKMTNDPIVSVAANFARQISSYKTMLDVHGVDWESQQELLHFFSGIHILPALSTILSNYSERDAINNVLRKNVKFGYTWHSCLNLLSATRAKFILAKHNEIILAVGGYPMVTAFNEVVPTIPDILDKIDNEIESSTNSNSKAKYWIEKLEWAINHQTEIDEATITDILSFIEHEANREALLEDAGITGNQPVTEVIFDLVLDVLGIPAHEDPRASSGHKRGFSREWFYEFFYSDYLLEKQENNLTIQKVVQTMKRECADNLSVHYTVH